MVLGMSFFFSTNLLFPIFLWAFISLFLWTFILTFLFGLLLYLFSLDFYFPFLIGLLFPFYFLFPFFWTFIQSRSPFGFLPFFFRNRAEKIYKQIYLDKIYLISSMPIQKVALKLQNSIIAPSRFGNHC